MSTQGDEHQGSGQPPSYDDLDQNQVFQPINLVLSRQVYHAELTDSKAITIQAKPWDCKPYPRNPKGWTGARGMLRQDHLSPAVKTRDRHIYILRQQH
ncbi:hypothetical protein VPNG_02993 [Cytospora leucostoma]|uniref:Uncharacterized protein n=1 Tax=Cytospora leucostoma TaxID=1230097 RepID=A0A423XGW5_9PEZI|nr:hypothetical protein VPNG_02993 [Cytospora leucostoma]